MIISFTAQQLVDWYTQGLASDIHHCNINGANGRIYNCASSHSPERIPKQGFPNFFLLHGIHADNLFREILDQAKTAAPRFPVSQASLTKTADSLICIDSDDYRIPASTTWISIAAGDLHGINGHNSHKTTLLTILI